MFSIVLVFLNNEFLWGRLRREDCIFTQQEQSILSFKGTPESGRHDSNATDASSGGTATVGRRIGTGSRTRCRIWIHFLERSVADNAGEKKSRRGPPS